MSSTLTLSSRKTDFYFHQFLSNFFKNSILSFLLSHLYNIFTVYFFSNYPLIKSLSSTISNCSCLLLHSFFSHTQLLSLLYFLSLFSSSIRKPAFVQRSSPQTLSLAPPNPTVFSFSISQCFPITIRNCRSGFEHFLLLCFFSYLIRKGNVMSQVWSHQS